MTATDDTGDELVKEIHTARVPRVDAVAGPAHGLPFLLLKAGDPAAQPTHLIPTAADGHLTKASTGMADDLAPDMPDPDLLADAAGVDELPGDPDGMPGSPAWEALDAATARAATSHLSALRRLVCGMQDREGEEVAAGHAEDAEDVMDLQQVLDALDCALGVLARFAVTEQAEADGGAQDVQDEARALGLVKTLEELPGRLAKAGRVLSAANEASLRAAHAAITDVLGRVAPAPSEESDMPMSDDAAPVAKAADTQDTQPPADGPAAEEAPVVKADDLSATPDADLRRMAITGSAGERNKALMELGMRAPTGAGPAPAADAAADGDAPADTDSAAAEPEQAAADQPADQPAPDAAPAAPATNSDVPEPQAPASDDEDPVTKALRDVQSIVSEAVKAAVEPLHKRLEAVEAQPVPGPMLNGATPGLPGMPAVPVTRGHAGDPADVQALRKALDDAADPGQRHELTQQLAYAQLRARYDNHPTA